MGNKPGHEVGPGENYKELSRMNRGIDSTYLAKGIDTYKPYITIG